MGENSVRKKVCDVKLRNKRKKTEVLATIIGRIETRIDKRLLGTRTEKWSGREEGIQQ